MTYSHFIWGSEPRANGGWHPWEILNVLPNCSEEMAQRCFEWAKQDNPGYLIVLTTEPKLPETEEVLNGQTSTLWCW
jgi:hypothetical protein